jgi:hypothetical protein
MHDETLPLTICGHDPDCSPFAIYSCDRMETPTGFAENVSDDFPELHVDRIVPLLVSTQQSQNDMNERNDAGDNTHHCRDCAFQCGNGNRAASNV